MNRALAAISLTAVVVTSAPSGAMDTGGYMKYSDTEFSQVFVWGVGMGYSWANVANIRAGRPPLYCQPPKLGMNSPVLNGMLGGYLQKQSEKGLLNLERPVELYLLEALQEGFPC